MRGSISCFDVAASVSSTRSLGIVWGGLQPKTKLAAGAGGRRGVLGADHAIEKIHGLPWKIERSKQHLAGRQQDFNTTAAKRRLPICRQGGSGPAIQAAKRN